jgi:hypothetical protein
MEAQTGTEQEEERLLDEPSESPPTAPRPEPSSSLSSLIIYFMTIHFLLAFSEIILIAPLLRLFENSLCLSHYGFPVGGVPESSCKGPKVQVPLATIKGWKSMLDTIPGISVCPVARLISNLSQYYLLPFLLESWVIVMAVGK